MITLTLMTAAALAQVPASASVEQDGIRASATLFPAAFTVGEPLTLVIEAAAEPGTLLVLPAGGESGSFTITGRTERLDIPMEDGRRHWQWVLSLDTFDDTATAIPEWLIGWSRGSDETGTVTLGPIPVDVVSVLAEETTMRDIKGEVPLPGGYWWIWSIAGGLVIGMVAGWLIVRRLRRSQSMLPHEQALTDLHLLRMGDLARDDVRLFYDRLSCIVRHYLEDRFSIRAPEQTTDEFLADARTSPQLNVAQRDELGRLLCAADMVKFARFEPGNSHSSAAIDEAEVFVSSTAATEAGVAA
ncbi:MAG: hypothetical protein QGG74_03870 [Phycisphaerales bacterium]|jgi:hypothetical protein|nr:hypothetical protein [Phycisphaerales bacterium]